MRNVKLVLFAVAFVYSLSMSTLEAQLLRRAAARSSAAPLSNFSGRFQIRVAQATDPVLTPYGPQSNWYPYVIARPADRQWIRETPIEMRPDRPLHFWGNSRRRLVR